MNLNGKKVVLIVTGGIAAYKSVDLASRLRKAGAEVRVVMTRSAQEFVTPLTFEAISGHPVYGRVFGDADSYRMEHIEWARWGDLVVAAPATADFIAKMAHGRADDAATTLLLAFRGPVWIAPAMNTAMWEHPATQANLETVRGRGVKVIGPGAGALACGEVGEGRMAEPEAILAELAFGAVEIARPLEGMRVILTAGPTRERLDPIRFISNLSTGRMGAALAARAAELGAKVELVHGPLSVPPPKGVTMVPAESAQEMLEAVQARLEGCAVAIFTAAVANYRPAELAGDKIKAGDTLDLHLVRTPDIAKWAGEHRSGARVLVGFTAESQNLLETAEKKLKDKKMDLIFANQIGQPGVGFESLTNEVTMIDKRLGRTASGLMTKEAVAGWIWEKILASADFTDGTKALK